MPDRKTLRRVIEPNGPITQATAPIDVLVTVTYDIGLGQIHDVPAVAVAWTQHEVQIEVRDWPATGPFWVPAADVRRA